jgi:hypothetical protein
MNVIFLINISIFKCLFGEKLKHMYMVCNKYYHYTLWFRLKILNMR